jgi:hypothetical protein
LTFGRFTRAMSADPSYLSHLGELATLKNFLGCYYHEDAWEDFDTDAEIRAAYRSSASDDELVRLAEQLQLLLARSDEEVHTFFRDNVHGLYFVEPSHTRAWLESLLQYLRGPRPDATNTT